MWAAQARVTGGWWDPVLSPETGNLRWGKHLSGRGRCWAQGSWWHWAESIMWAKTQGQVGV